MIGQRVGNYTILSLLGEGGMGTVYLAEHPEIGRKVAVKVLREELASDEGLLSRFLNEARAANAIRHPNIIEVLDGGRTSTGKPYMVMELLEGEPLSARLARLGRLPIREALELSYQAASALAAAHAKGIIHRDLKPDNLYVIADPLDPSRLLLKVLDFGIAKLQTQPRIDSFRTRTGTLMGTPTYMSPEQCLGTKEVDLRSDVYALGVILFEMLTGAPPFSSEGFGELVNMHINLPPPDPQRLVPELSAAVSAVVFRCLAKKPEERFASMTELQAALRTAAGSMRLGGRSSPNLDAPEMGRTMALPDGASAPTKVPSSPGGRASTIAGAVGEARAPRRRGVMVGGLVTTTALGIAVLAFVRSPSPPHHSSTRAAAPPEAPAAVAPRPSPSQETPGVVSGQGGAAASPPPVEVTPTTGTSLPAAAQDRRAPWGDRMPVKKDGSHRPRRPKAEREDEPAKL